MTTMPPELRAAIEQAGDEPARIIDLTTNTEYVLLRADLYEPSPSSEVTADDFTAEEMTQQMWQSMKEDWTDPKMDVYDGEEYA